MSVVRPLPSGLELGDELQVERSLGSGTFGITYLVKALKTIRGSIKKGRRYVVKELAIVDCVKRARDGVGLVPLGDNDQHREIYWNHFRENVATFEQEARTLAQLRHRGVVEVLMIRRANSTAYIVMEHVDGQDLSDLIQGTWRRHSRGLLWSELKPKVPLLLDALAHVHRADIIHRDLKPANIRLRKNGAPVLIDFGGARKEKSAHRSMVLSPGHAGPEQIYNMRVLRGDISGDLMPIGPSADIYGLAACFYSALTATALYDLDDNMRVVGHRPRLQDHPNLSRMGIPHRVAKAIDWALSPDDPSARPQSVDQWRGEFGDLGGGRKPAPEPKDKLLSPDQIYQNAERLRADQKKQNKGEIAKLYRQAADLGHAAAAYRMGRLLQLGTGVRKDKAQAEQYFLMAAERGDVRGAFRLAESQLARPGENVNSARAFQLIESAAQQGFAPAQNLLGRYHRKGMVVAQSDRIACDWYERALYAGDADAAHNLAAMYARGLGRPQDKQISDHLFRAEQKLRSGESVDVVLRNSPVLAKSLSGS